MSLFKIHTNNNRSEIGNQFEHIIITVNDKLNNNYSRLNSNNKDFKQVIFNNKLNKFFRVDGKDITIIEDTNIVFEINFPVYVDLNNVDNIVYTLPSLKIYLNNEIVHKKKYGFDAQNIIKDNLLFKLKSGDKMIFETDTDIKENSFIYVLLD